MFSDNIVKTPKGKLKASLQKEFRLNFVDFFVDHTDIGRDIHVVPGKTSSLSDYLVYWSSSPLCPSCNQPQLKQSEKWSVKEWLIRYFGRRVFRCGNCGWEETIKLYRWEWETIVTVLAVVVVLLIASFHWFSG